MKKWLGGIVLMLGLMPALAQAASPWTEEKTYSDKVAGKLQFGLTNLMLGWTAVIAESEQAADEKKNVVAAAGKGLVYFVADTVGGVLHTVTAPIPQIDIPLPENGVST
ncbi:MAG: hypothetical protein WC352_04645 [Candidatus Omnitrophota bacterium]|jgi:hypothetical protein